MENLALFFEELEKERELEKIKEQKRKEEKAKNLREIKKKEIKKIYNNFLNYYYSNDLTVFEKTHFTQLIEKFINKIYYPFNNERLIGRYYCSSVKVFCFEKKGIRVEIETNFTVLHMLNYQDLKTFLNRLNFRNLRSFCQYGYLNYEKFEVFKNFKFLKSDFLILSSVYSAKVNSFKKEQHLKQLDRLKIPLRIRPKKWIPKKGMVETRFNTIFFNPYIKPSKNLKNKLVKKFYIPTKIKTISSVPNSKKGYRYFVILDIKKKVWAIQTKYIVKNLKYLGTIYVHKPGHFFILGIDGVPVLLHWKELYSSYKKKKKTKTLFKFTEVFLVKIIEKCNTNKRINVIINKKIIIKKNFELIFKFLITAIKSLKTFNLTKSLYKKK
jgi:hypothetical protein